MDLDKEEIMRSFDGIPEDLAEKYSRATLNKCYNTLYGNNPPSAWRKVDVVRGIQKMKQGIDRAKAMKP